MYVERKRRKVANSFSFSSAGYVTSCGCMFNLFDGSRQREEYGPLAPLPPPNRPHPGYRDSTITHASECKLPEAVNHFEKIPDSPRAPSLRVCLRYPFPLLSLSSSSSFTPFFAFFYVLIESCPRSIVLSRPRLAFVGLRKVTECSLRKGSPAPIDGRGMCSGP